MLEIKNLIFMQQKRNLEIFEFHAFSCLFRLLVVDTEERLALFTLGLVLVDELVERVEARARGAVHVVPPVADEVLLVEHGAVGTEEAVGVTVRLAHVESLKKKVNEKIFKKLFSDSQMLTELF